MKKIRELKIKHVFLFVIIGHFLYYWLRVALVRVAKAVGLIEGYTNASYMWTELIVLIVAIFFLWLTSQTHVLRCDWKSLGKGLWSGTVFFVLAAMAISMSVSNGKEQQITYKAFPEIAAFVIFVFLVGLAEEFFYRGMIADCIYERFGKSVPGVILSVILGGIFFGMAHITNILSGQSVERTIVQVVATSMLGILLTAIYIRHKNIFAVAILHGVLDFFTMFEKGLWEGFTLQRESSDINFWASLKQSLISQSVFVIVAIFILRPVIMRKIVARKQG